MDNEVHQSLVKRHLQKAQKHCQECQALHKAMAEHFDKRDSAAAGIHENLSTSYGDFAGHITNTLASFADVPTHDEGGSAEELANVMKAMESEI